MPTSNYRRYSAEGNQVRITFPHAGQGLAFQHGQRLQGFAVAGEDKLFHWADAVIDGSTVVVSCAQVAKPVAVRYAWGNDQRTRQVRRLTPQGSEAATAIPYLCQIRYDAGQDVLLVGATLPPDADGCRRTPVYDGATNRWQALKLAGDDPSGKTGRNVSLGLLYDARRKLFWAVNARSRVFVLRLDVKTADPQDLHFQEPKP